VLGRGRINANGPKLRWVIDCRHLNHYTTEQVVSAAIVFVIGLLLVLLPRPRKGILMGTDIG